MLDSIILETKRDNVWNISQSGTKLNTKEDIDSLSRIDCEEYITT